MFERFKSGSSVSLIPHIGNVLAEILFNEGMEREAKEILGHLPQDIPGRDAVDAAILCRRLKKPESAEPFRPLPVLKIIERKKGSGDCPQGFDFVFFAPFHPKQDSLVVFAGILRRRTPWSRSFRGFCEKIGTPCRFSCLSTCKVFALLRKKREEGQAKGRVLREFPQKTRKFASGEMARKKQNQKQKQNPGGNPPDPFFLSIVPNPERDLNGYMGP
ncbi:MAG: hypothetical protein HQL76_06410 [Magnetococcales bacterium]|nr:hypothetical protein [Magnetococcales bacterium]